MKENEEKMHLPKVTLDDFFTTQEERDNKNREYVTIIPIKEISDFPNHPYKVRDDDEMFSMAETVKQFGVIHPVVVRKKENGGYEMISGHRRKRACEIAGITHIKAIVREMTDEEATIIMVDSNKQREKILPSEKAFAYKMKLEAEKHQGMKTCGQEFHKSRDDITDDMSGRQVQRYIRLTYLIPELLELVDNTIIDDKSKQKIALLPAVEISYLSKDEQFSLFETIECLQATPSHAQAIIMKKKSEAGKLSFDDINNILSSEKPNQVPTIKLNEDRFTKILPKTIKTKEEREDYIYHCVVETIKRENKQKEYIR